MEGVGNLAREPVEFKLQRHTSDTDRSIERAARWHGGRLGSPAADR
jgi:hypothetical protein